MLHFRFRAFEYDTNLHLNPISLQREPLAWVWIRYTRTPGLGVSRPATSVVINLSEKKKEKKRKKRWQIKACKCSYFLYTTRQKELMSHCAVPQITPREKNSSPQTAECGGSSPSGGVVLRLIGLCGIQWTWLRPSTRRARRPPHWRNADTLGEYSSMAIFVVFLLAPFLEVSLPAQLQMAFTLQRHASLVPTLVAYSKSAGIIYSITIFRFSQSQI